MMPDGLLAEVTALADTHFGPDPIAEAAAVEPDYRGVPVPEFTPQPDPDAGQPYAVNGDAVFSALCRSDVGFVIRHGGREFVDRAASFLGAVPREVTGSMHELGMLGSEHSWALMADLGSAMGDMPLADIAACEDVPEIGELEAYARATDYPADIETVSNIRVFLSGLPPPARAAAAHVMLADADLWDLAALIGGKLWGYTAMTQRSDH